MLEHGWENLIVSLLTSSLESNNVITPFCLALALPKASNTMSSFDPSSLIGKCPAKGHKDLEGGGEIIIRKAKQIGVVQP